MNINSLTQKHLIDEYKSRINHVIDYIEQNLDDNFSLESLAKIANFSKYHFHRIFFALMGETLFNFIQRIRIEKSAFLLSYDPKKSITEIALECGFGSSQAFARSFKNYFHVSATSWRKKNKIYDYDEARFFIDNKDNNKLPSNTSIIIKDNSQIWNIPFKNENRIIIVKKIPRMTVAYIRYIGPYKGDAVLFKRLWNRLFKWASCRNIINIPDTQFIIIYHDDIKITDKNKLRISFCITIDEKTVIDGEVGKMEIPGGKYACARFVLSPQEFEYACDWVYGVWLPASGYIPDDRPCFEMYPQEYNNDYKNNQIVMDICIPVKPF